MGVQISKFVEMFDKLDDIVYEPVRLVCDGFGHGRPPRASNEWAEPGVTTNECAEPEARWARHR